MKRVSEPEWTPEQVMRVRKIYRRGGTVQEVAEMLQTKLNNNAVRDRALALGMRFINVPRNHHGTSKMVQPDAS
jgi:hypothetical protein